jgi:polyferredoxin
MQTTEFYRFIIYFAKSAFFLGIYLRLCFIFDKIIKKKIIKAFLIGLITPFFFYYFIMNFIHPVSYILYITSLYDPSVAILIVGLTAKPLSVFLGIIVTAILLVQEDFIKNLNINSDNTKSKK